MGIGQGVGTSAGTEQWVGTRAGHYRHIFLVLT